MERIHAENKIILVKLTGILVRKLFNVSSILLKTPENTEYFEDLNKEFAQITELLSWCNELLCNYRSENLVLFCQFAADIQKEQRDARRRAANKRVWDAIKPDFMELLHAELIGAGPGPILTNHY